jgi:hypothetical protein
MLPYILRFPSGHVAVLTKSLCIAQDFLTAIWLCWSSEQGQFRGSHSSKWWKRHRPDASFPQAMTVIVLAAVGFLACVFFLLVLFQWTRDTRRKTTTVVDAAGETSEKKRPHIVGSRRTVEKRDRFGGGHAGSRAGEVGRPVAGPDATSANGLRTRRSPGR